MGLASLFFLDESLAWKLFTLFWVISGVVYLIVTLVSCVIDSESAAKSWREGILFPGIISLFIIAHSLFPPAFVPFVEALSLDPDGWVRASLTLFLYAWISLGMAVAYAAKWCETRGHRRLARALLYTGGYGAFLCAVTVGAYVMEFRGAEMKWDKTEKTGKVG